MKEVKDLLEEKNLNPVTHVVTINGKPVVEERKIKENDEIKVYSVTSSG